MSKESAESIEKAASLWLVRAHSNEWSAVEQSALERWLAAAVEHRVAYLRLERAWQQSDRLRALGAGHASLTPPPPGAWTLTPFFGESEQTQTVARPVDTRVAPRRARTALALAASLLVCVATAWYLYPEILAQMQGAHGTSYSTPIGGLAYVPTSDGSRITLNTNSAIHVAMTQSGRQIQLERGEAFFEVARDPSRPFRVGAGTRTITALGTAFSVRRGVGNDIQVIVTDGTVRIDGAEPSQGTADSAILAAGAVAHSTSAGTLIEDKPLPQAEEQLSWRTGMLIFRNESLLQAIQEFNRYNTRQLVVDDARIGALRIEGNFRATNLDGFVHLLEAGFGLQVEQHGNRINLSQK